MPKRRWKKRGRPRKDGERINGRLVQSSRAKREYDMKRHAVEARAKHTGLTCSQAEDPLTGFPYGLLYKYGDIQQDQFAAATIYHERTEAAYRMKGLPMPRVPSMSAFSFGGQSLRAEPEPETVQDAWRAYHQLADALMLAGRDASNDAGACRRIVHEICFVMDRDVAKQRLSPEELGNLRMGLNAVHRAVMG